MQNSAVGSTVEAIENVVSFSGERAVAGSSPSVDRGSGTAFSGSSGSTVLRAAMGP